MYRAYGTTVDEFLRSHPVTTPDYIKIDVDGIEHAILEGPRETFKAGSVKSVPVEVNENFSEQFLACAEILTDCGYKVSHRVQPGLEMGLAAPGLYNVIFERA
jgi:hypothetical protein